MGSQENPVHVLFFPFMAPGHMNPIVDLAILFTRRGVKATILTTPANVPLIQPSIDHANHRRLKHHHPIPFPSTEVGLPEGCENYSCLPFNHPINPCVTFIQAVKMLHKPFDQVLTDLAPHCVVSDFFFSWTREITARHGVPRLEFHGTSFFSLCHPNSFGECTIDSSLTVNKANKLDASVNSIYELESVNELKSNKVIHYQNKAQVTTCGLLTEKKAKNFGVIVNSFYELESDYAKQIQTMVTGKAWYIGPTSLCDQEEEDMSRRGGISVDCNACIQWLDSQVPGSVVYVCFGSLSNFTLAQLPEIGLGLCSSGLHFIWVLSTKYAGYVPQEYEERVRGRGVIVRGWAPQILILNHKAIGGFVTHCGWNSCLEALNAGVPLVTWPLFADQFHNERLMVEVLGVGVSLRVKEIVELDENEPAAVKADEICKAVQELMGSGEVAENRRRRVSLLKNKARMAVKKGGSSYSEIENLITTLKSWWGPVEFPPEAHGGIAHLMAKSCKITKKEFEDIYNESLLTPDVIDIIDVERLL